MTLKEFKQELRIVGATDNALDTWFEAVAQMWVRGLYIPKKYCYSPGVSSDPREEGNYFYELFNESTDVEITQIAEFLFNYGKFTIRQWNELLN